ncbi:DUF3084 domain-containing protein [Aphanothece sacrum]|uniref:DUF3084 domain-containing protein n=1 Tax=Aphanothece sacrum FPU1 TaxID=1920663 RepID=A0A401IJ02_APHSA|nr:DUF3084 domain-containing protein [Aphanothece sacrum]GBF81081.1 hypothetical protein AsFPU1_2490 [Aphanothece sacrum FPU1]GBF85482.1 hypothetical protein AsFPU3_2541 [Aphanothece sacrum FPU3]
MTSAYILIAAILILGGLIAALGDRLGTKVGKARMRIGNLRPKQTAILVTVMTGTLISASTLIILFTLSKSLREGLFQLDEIQKQLRTAKGDLERVANDKQDIEKQLYTAKTEQKTVQKQLESINQNFTKAQQQLKTVVSQGKKLREDIQTLLKEREELVRNKTQLDQQISQLQSEIRNRDTEVKRGKTKISAQNRVLQERQSRLKQLESRLQNLQQQQSKLQTEIDNRDVQIVQLDQAINLKDLAVKNRESQLKKSERELIYLQRQVDILEQYYQNYQDLRERQIALVKGQVLSIGGVRIVDPNAAIQAIDELLRQANRTAIESVGTEKVDPNDRVVKITKSQVDQLNEQLKDGKEYVVRIISAGNYVKGEKEVRVFADVVPNQKIFNADETIATVSMESLDLTEENIQKRLDILLAATQFRSRSAGVVGNIQVGDGRLKTMLNFIEQISKAENGLDEIRVISLDDTYTIGPLKVRLIGIKNGEIIFGT